MNQIYIVVEGGCVRYVASKATDIEVTLVDLDDMNEAQFHDRNAHDVIREWLTEAQALPRIW